MNYAEAKRIVKSFSYKPGCWLKIDQCGRGVGYAGINLHFTLAVNLKESDHVSQGWITNHRFFDSAWLEHVNEALFKHAIYEQVRWVELHELDEWMKFDGRYFTEPHPEETT